MCVPYYRLQIPESVATIFVDEVLLHDGEGGDQVCSISGRKWASLENHHKVGNVQVSFEE